MTTAETMNIPIHAPAATTGNSPFIGAQPFDGVIQQPITNPLEYPEYDLLARLPYFNFKNGRLNQATSLLVKASIPPGYFWRPIDGLPAERAKEFVGIFVKSAYLGLWDNRPSSIPAEKVLKAAVILGVARAVATSFYDINTQDLIPGETASAVIRAIHTGNGEYMFSTVPDLSANMMAHASDNITFDDVIRTVIPSIHMSAIGIPALQGWSLMMTGHHYLSDPGSPSRKAYSVVERQFWRANNVASWWNDDSDLCMDCLWHKACHPINLQQKFRWATDERIKEMIVMSGAGSAASRLPAKESELRAANSYIVLFQTVRGMYEAYGGALDHSVLDYALDLTASYPADATAPQLPIAREPDTPSWVVDRPSALRLVGEILKANTDVAAHAFGFYMAMSEQSALMGNVSTSDTIKTSFSLVKLRNQSPAAYTAGFQAFSDYNAFRTTQRQAGKYEPMRLGMRYAGLVPPEGVLPGV